MKIPKAKQLPSGLWRVQIMLDGQRISITRETRKAAEAEAAALKSGVKSAGHRSSCTVRESIDSYIEARTNVLSPSTIRGYRFIQRGRFQSMMDRPIASITQAQWQRAVNAEASLCSAKTLQNAWRFLVSVISEATGQHMSVRTPQVVQNEHPYLNPDQIQVFVDAVKGTSVEIPALLALCSLRRSELLALKWDQIDLAEGVAHVSGAAVYDDGGQLVRKATNKNRSSARVVPLIPPLREALEAAEDKTGNVVTMSPAGMFQRINRICVSNGLPKVGIHGLRHSFASLAYHLGIREKIAMEIGGWANDQTMKKIYTHISRADVESKYESINAFYRNAHEIAHEN